LGKRPDKKQIHFSKSGEQKSVLKSDKKEDTRGKGKTIKRLVFFWGRRTPPTLPLKSLGGRGTKKTEKGPCCKGWGTKPAPHTLPVCGEWGGTGGGSFFCHSRRMRTLWKKEVGTPQKNSNCQKKPKTLTKIATNTGGWSGKRTGGGPTITVWGWNKTTRKSQQTGVGTDQKRWSRVSLKKNGGQKRGEPRQRILTLNARHKKFTKNQPLKIDNKTMRKARQAQKTGPVLVATLVHLDG